MAIEITTAARLITRHVNASPATTVAFYDSEGNALRAVAAKTATATPAPEGAAARIHGRMGAPGGHITAREVQAMLDVADLIGTVDGEDFDLVLACHLYVNA
ncbi:hypothetical protein HF995_13320 [Sanguibacter hominis ATCC BAA-789]|uniref:Uncharacterized protein n=1 Tax=Sanguibacter hominis ATCC BAA-789 TaxID=1312740 RepID=A0A9X5ITE1_9MICO|nr:hypothetical protein [Sanguibacter hominis]NKX94236.1 hypothetical protein [Sanguibacter hominis ATCC BAA-789]